jgi:succinoglycan biosynthesis protein ExoV
MRLNYYNINNFGDALNPIIFNKLLPDFFDNDPSVQFVGIGSIIGAKMKNYQHKIIFSAGYAYGRLPKLDDSYEITCVRGPLTAKVLKVNPGLAVTDGAALLREFSFQNLKKEYAFSFMPHFESEKKFPWKDLCSEAGINYVSPKADPIFIIEEIIKSKTVIAEAMHFAIVADTLRVPWIAVKAYPGINDFKWKDWTSSLNMNYKPLSLASLFEEERLYEKLMQKTRQKLPRSFYRVLARSYISYQERFLKKATIKRLRNISTELPQLSNDSVFNEKVDCLLERLDVVKQKYQKNRTLNF